MNLNVDFNKVADRCPIIYIPIIAFFNINICNKMKIYP